MRGRRQFVKTRQTGPARMARLAAATTQFRRAAYAQARGGRGAAYPAQLRGGRGATEVKAIDNNNGQPNIIPFLTAGTISSPLSNAAGTNGYPVEGAGFYNRIGRRIRMKSLQMDGMITPGNGNAAAVGQQFARIMVVYDRQANGAMPSVADVLTNYDSGGGTSGNQPAYQHLNMNNRDRFIVLRDRKIILPALGINGATPAALPGVVTDPNVDNTSLVFREFIKLKGLETHFKNSSGGGPVGDISTGSLFVLCVSSADANASAAWQLQITARLKFDD